MKTEALTPHPPCGLLRCVLARLCLVLLLPGTGAWASEPQKPAPDPVDPGHSGEGGKAGDPGWFAEVATSSGLDFVHFNGMSGRLYYPEVVGAGGALFDYDNDGDLDLYLVQGSMLGPDRKIEDALFPPPHPPPFKDRLYRNDLVVGPDGSRALSFTDVTQESGIEALGYGMGVATGDYNNDGWVDLYVTNFGPNQMWRNNGRDAHGRVTFSQVTEATHTGEPRWSVGASFLDYDRDGWLDLMVANYIDFTFLTHKVCVSERGEEDYCLPSAYRPVSDRLFHNKGDGSFEDVSTANGFLTDLGSGLGVVAADLNGDTWIDLYVANDLMPNQLWLNQGNGTFLNDGLASGSALNQDGQAEASMGVGAADFDSDGDMDLFMTHFARETNTLYLNDGQGFFLDATVERGLAGPSWSYTSFGTGWFDYDNDGWLDLLVANGGVTFPAGVDRKKRPFPLDEVNQLFRNLGPQGAGRGPGFEDVSVAGGPVFRLSEVSRGALFGDLDNDGDTDVVITNNNGPVRLLRNDLGHQKPWLGLRLLGAETSPRDQLGTRVGIFRRQAPTLWRRVATDGSYASAGDPRILVGLTAGSEVSKVRVEWPDGRVEEWGKVPLGTYTTLRQGSGKVAE